MKPLADVPGTRMRTLYLNDHLAAAAGWIALARRMARNNSGSELGDVLLGLQHDLAEELPLLRALLRESGGHEQKTKQWLALSAERLGRLKLNGALRGYSPLSRLVEAEAMVAALALRAAMWRSLAAGYGEQHPLGRFTLGELAQRAERQAGDLDEPLRSLAGALAA